MRMKMFAAVSLVITLPVFVLAQQRGGGRGAAPLTPTDTTNATQVTAAELTAALATLGIERPNSTVRVFSIAPYTANIEHRTSQPQNGSVHEDEAELFYVVDGSGTMVTGGKLVGDAIKTIEGGTAHKLNKGDFLIVPKGVPHWFSQIDGQVLNIMSLHLPMPK
jgi:mannose-6-phosphate isomerase-like protein (cupin superfamily)